MRRRSVPSRKKRKNKRGRYRGVLELNDGQVAELVADHVVGHANVGDSWDRTRGLLNRTAGASEVGLLLTENFSTAKASVEERARAGGREVGGGGPDEVGLDVEGVGDVGLEGYELVYESGENAQQESGE